jgi:hypothetical protein
MISSMRDNEFTICTAALREMREALSAGDYETARLAAEELESIAMYTDWQLIVRRCADALGEYPRRLGVKEA